MSGRQTLLFSILLSRRRNHVEKISFLCTSKQEPNTPVENVPHVMCRCLVSLVARRINGEGKKSSLLYS